MWRFLSPLQSCFYAGWVIKSLDVFLDITLERLLAISVRPGRC